MSILKASANLAEILQKPLILKQSFRLNWNVTFAFLKLFYFFIFLLQGYDFSQKFATQ